MFDIGWTELLLIAIVAIVVIGPKDLPRAMRAVGQWSGKLKRMAREFQGQFNEAMREAELDGVQRDLQKVTKIDPLGTVRKELAGIESSMRGTPAKPSVTPAVTAAAAPETPAATVAAAVPAPPAASEPVASAGAPAPTPGAAT